MPGLLRVRGTIDLDQFWPTGSSDADTSKIKVTVGKDSFAYHAHMLEEEWVYILSGRGIAEIDGQSHEVETGDFMGFATPSVPHLLKNPYEEDLVYLMGGENKPLDVLDYPALGKRYLLIGSAGGTEFYELGAPIKPFGAA